MYVEKNKKKKIWLLDSVVMTQHFATIGQFFLNTWPCSDSSCGPTNRRAIIYYHFMVNLFTLLQHANIFTKNAGCDLTKTRKTFNTEIKPFIGRPSHHQYVLTNS
jgi:hypothetical protein